MLSRLASYEYLDKNYTDIRKLIPHLTRVAKIMVACGRVVYSHAGLREVRVVYIFKNLPRF
jgi:hypothetical protein